MEATNQAPLTNEQIAIRQWLGKSAPYISLCGCMGCAPLPQDPGCLRTKYEPVCYCAMRYVEVVDGKYYKIIEHRSPDGITHTTKMLGPIGGPYTVDSYGRDIA